MAASVVAGAKGITVAPGVSGSPLTLGTATATVRQVPATVVTTQTVRGLFSVQHSLCNHRIHQHF